MARLGEGTFELTATFVSGGAGSFTFAGSTGPAGARTSRLEVTSGGTLTAATGRLTAAAATYIQGGGSTRTHGARIEGSIHGVGGVAVAGLFTTTESSGTNHAGGFAGSVLEFATQVLTGFDGRPSPASEGFREKRQDRSPCHRRWRHQPVHTGYWKHPGRRQQQRRGDAAGRLSEAVRDIDCVRRHHRRHRVGQHRQEQAGDRLLLSRLWHGNPGETDPGLAWPCRRSGGERHQCFRGERKQGGLAVDHRWRRVHRQSFRAVHLDGCAACRRVKHIEDAHRGSGAGHGQFHQQRRADIHCCDTGKQQDERPDRFGKPRCCDRRAWRHRDFAFGWRCEPDRQFRG